MFGWQSRLDGFHPDKGANRVYVDENQNDNRVIVERPISGDITMNCFCRLTTVKSVGSLWVVHALGHDFYVDAAGGDSPDKDLPIFIRLREDLRPKI